MGRYTIEISKEALADLSKIKKSGKKADISKIEKIFLEQKYIQQLELVSLKNLNIKTKMYGLDKLIKKTDQFMKLSTTKSQSL